MLHRGARQTSLGKHLHGVNQDLSPSLGALSSLFTRVYFQYLIHYLTNCIYVTATTLHLTSTPENVYCR